MKVGYIRVSTKEQNTERQERSIEADKYFIEKISGKNAERQELKNIKYGFKNIFKSNVFLSTELIPPKTESSAAITAIAKYVEYV